MWATLRFPAEGLSGWAPPLILVSAMAVFIGQPPPVEQAVRDAVRAWSGTGITMTEAAMQAIRIDVALGPGRLQGDILNAAALPSGSRFHTRCAFAKYRCRADSPASRMAAPGHRACHDTRAFDVSRAPPA